MSHQFTQQSQQNNQNDQNHGNDSSSEQQQATPQAIQRLQAASGADGGDVNPQDILRLQRTLGNQAVQRMLAGRNTPVQQSTGLPIVQRQTDPPDTTTTTTGTTTTTTTQQNDQQQNDDQQAQQNQPLAPPTTPAPQPPDQQDVNNVPQDDGLVDLGDGLRGEVGMPGRIKANTVVERVGSSDYTVPVEARVIVHEIIKPEQDTTHYWVQIPRDVMGRIVDEQIKKGPAYQQELSDMSRSERKRRKAQDKKESAKKADYETDTAKKGEVTKKVGNREKKVALPAAVMGRVAKGQLNHDGVRFKHVAMPANTPIFPPDREPNANDVRQGGLGDCYFVASLAAVARKNPNHIRGMFMDNGATVSVTFYNVPEDETQNPTPEQVVVRKTIATSRKSQGGGTAFASTQLSYWPALAEKAYAKWSGGNKDALVETGYKASYQSIVGGTSDNAWAHITGRRGGKISIGESSKMMMGTPGINEFLSAIKGSEYANLERVIYPWDYDTMFGKMQHPPQEGETITSIAQMYGLKPDDLYNALMARYGAYPAFRSVVEALGLNNVILNNQEANPNNKIYAITLPEGAIFKQKFPTMTDDDVAKWKGFVGGTEFDKAMEEAKKVKGYNTDVFDTDGLEKVLELSGLSDNGKQLIRQYTTPMLLGTASKPNYPVWHAKRFWDIAKKLSEGYVGLSTPEFGSGGGGLSANEDVVSIPGLAGNHAYEVVSVTPSWDNKPNDFADAPDFYSRYTPPDGGRYMVKLRNPWGQHGAVYDSNYKMQKQTLSGTNDSIGGEFQLELSDIYRYFNRITYGKSTEAL